MLIDWWGNESGWQPRRSGSCCRARAPWRNSKQPSDPKVTRKLFGQILTKNFNLSLQPILRVPLDSKSVFCKIVYDACFEWFWPVKEKIRKNDQIDENKKRPVPRPIVRKWNVHVIWMIVDNDFYEHIWKQTYLASLWTWATKRNFCSVCLHALLQQAPGMLVPP